MQNKLNILFFSIEGTGHMNACIGVAQVLKDAGHRIVFAISDQWKGRLLKYGFEEVVAFKADIPKDVDPSVLWADMFKSTGALGSVSPLEAMVGIWTQLMPMFVNAVKESDPVFDEVIKSVRPDVLVLDQMLTYPSVELSGIPWVNLCSFQPLFYIEDQWTPPKGSGLSAYGDKKEWKQYMDVFNKAIEPITEEFNQWVVSRGVQPLEKFKFLRDSPFLNIYGYPLELDYTDIRPLPPNWYRFDNLKRTEHVKWDVPEQLKNKPGKLIYFSLGTIGTGELDLMKKLIGYLSESKHRFIVSKGPHHDKINLPDNMWGEKSVPQIQVLPVVDMVITHGGNNTTCETFYFGKPMLVMPMFSDQHDNAQRITEKGLGLRLSPHKCTKEELLNAIDTILNDSELNQRMKNIGKRIQSENSIAKIPEIIEKRLNEFNRHSFIGS